MHTQHIIAVLAFIALGALATEEQVELSVTQYSKSIPLTDTTFAFLEFDRTKKSAIGDVSPGGKEKAKRFPQSWLKKLCEGKRDLFRKAMEYPFRYGGELYFCYNPRTGGWGGRDPSLLSETQLMATLTRTDGHGYEDLPAEKPGKVNDNPPPAPFPPDPKLGSQSGSSSRDKPGHAAKAARDLEAYELYTRDLEQDLYAREFEEFPIYARGAGDEYWDERWT